MTDPNPWLDEEAVEATAKLACILALLISALAGIATFLVVA